MFVSPAQNALPTLMSIKVMRLSACLVLLWSCTAAAQSEEPVWSFNGFASLGLVHSSENSSDYVPGPLLSQGVGRSENPSAVPDSRAALQVNYQANPQLSATVQFVLEQDFRGDVRPRLEWANLQYHASERLSVRVGRIALNTFMVSDYRKVGYAQPWVRPPAELYHLVGITNSDGIDATYRFSHEGTHYSSQLVYGRNRLTETGGGLEVSNLWGSFNRLERGPLTLHAGLLSAKLQYGFYDELWQAYRAFGPAGETLVADYDASGKWAPFLAFGAAWDAGEWFLQGEWGRGDTRSDYGKRAGWYLSAGMRQGDWAPYLTYARARGSERDAEGLDPAQFAAPLTPLLEELNNVLFLFQSAVAPRQETISVGLRRDLYPGISATAQYDRVSTLDGSIGLFRNLETSRYRPSGANVLSFSLDFVF